MAEIFRIPSDRQPWLDPDSGLISRPWFLFLQGLFIRIGAATGSSSAEQDFGFGPATGDTDQIAVFMRQIQDLGVAPVVQQLEQQVFSLESELSSQRELLAELSRTVQGLQAGTTI